MEEQKRRWVYISALLEGERDLLSHEGAALDGIQQLLGAFLRPRGDRDDHLQPTSDTLDPHAHLRTALAVPSMHA